MASILDCPSEIIFEIINYIDEPQDLCNLYITNKILYNKINCMVWYYKIKNKDIEI